MVNKLMPTATKFNELYEYSKRWYDDVIDIIAESTKVYNNKYGDEIKEMFITKSGYCSPDTKIAIDEKVEFNSANPPDFSYAATHQAVADGRRTINKVIRNIMQLNNIDAKLVPTHLAGYVEGTGVAESIFEPVFEEGWEIPDTDTFAQINSQRMEQGLQPLEKPIPTKYKRKVTSAINMNYYSIIKNDVRLDPIASSFDLKGTSRWCIVKVGDFTKEDIMKLAEEYRDDPKFYFNMDQIQPMMHKDDYRQREIESKEGVHRQPTISIHKIFYNNGLVDWIVNRNLIAAEGVVNNKMVAEMPLTFFVPKPSIHSPYGLPLWAETKKSNDVKSGAINLMADLVAKNVKASILTTSQELASKSDASELCNDKIVYVSNQGDERARVTDLVSQMQWNDMTPGLAALINTADADISRIARTTQLTQGFQQKQVRTDGIAQAMQQSQNMSAAMLTKQTENTLHQPIARDILSILRNYYPEFNLDIPREFISPAALRVRNGSSLEEDRLSRSQVLGMLKQDASISPLDWNGIKINEDFYETLGVPEVKEYMSSPDKMLLKIYTAMGLDEQQVAQMQGATQKVMQQGGQ